ncbi:MAG: FAD-dependent oxidoreductase [Clostridium sp.]
MSKRVIVIGGGASGMTAAIFAARQGAAVTLLEHMDRVGKKILSTGNGKCNLTNRRMDARYRSSAPEFPWRS